MKILTTAAIVVFMILNSCSSAPEFNPKVNDVNGRGNHNNNEVSIITYNVQTILGKGEDKILGLSNYLDQELYDFVLLQEVFDEKTRSHLLENVNSRFYKSKIPRIDYSSFPSNICQDAGLFSISRFPKVDLSHIDFDENTDVTSGAVHQMLIKELSISMDIFSNKSVLGTLYQIDDSTKLFLFTTHLQAISSRRHRTNQLKQIYAFIENAVTTILKNNLINDPKDLIVILTGDFNYDAYDESDVETIQKYLGAPRDLYGEFNTDLKEYSIINNMFRIYKRFDYIFAYDRIGQIPLKNITVNSINITDVKDKNGSSISDHLALKAVLKVD
ncbi:MAG: hypothetical protein ABFS12_15260 [Bacteroidota bacterium]